MTTDGMSPTPINQDEPKRLPANAGGLLRRLKPLWRQIILVALLATNIASHYLYVSPFPTGSIHWEPWRILFAGTLLLFVLVSGLRVKPFPRQTVNAVVLWLLFAVSVGLSTIYHDEGYAYAIWYLFGVPVLFFNIFPVLFGRRGNFIIAWSLVIASGSLLLLSLLVEPLRFGMPYKGILAYQTHAGQVGGMLIVGLLCLLGEIIDWGVKKRSKLIALSLLLIGAFVMVVSTAYRTAIVTSVVLLILFVAINYTKSRRLMQVYALFSVIILAVLMGIWVSGVGEKIRFWEAVVKKQQHRMAISRGGVTSYRDEQFLSTVSHANLLGHGQDARQDLQTAIGFHSAFTYVLGTYGIIATLFFTSFWLVSLIRSYQYLNLAADTDHYRMVPLLCMTFFIMFSLGSKMMYPWLTGPTVPPLLAIGVVVMQRTMWKRSAIK